MPETTPIPVLRWRCDIARPAPRALQIYRGETARLECLLTLQGDPATIPADATALIAWQSRDMGASWYTAEASVDVSRGAVLADFTPAMDSGAAEFRAFLRVDGGEGSGICYRAAALLQMLDSPGATINEIPIPPRVLDFATIEVLNAPYWTKAEADARFASVADATLNGRGFGPWTVTPDTVEIVREYDTAHGDPKWVLYPYQGGVPIGLPIDDTGQTTATWTAGGSASIDVTATRTALPGYVLGPADGPNADKPIPKLSDVPAVVAPSTDASAAGKAADAKATGDALAGKLNASMSGSGNGDLAWGMHSLRLSNATLEIAVLKMGNTSIVASPNNVSAILPAVSGELALVSQIPDVSSETWTFEVDDGQGGTTTVTKSVAVFAAAQNAQNAQSAQGGA